MAKLLAKPTNEALQVSPLRIFGKEDASMKLPFKSLRYIDL